MASFPRHIITRASTNARLSSICPRCRQYATTQSTTSLPAPPLLLKLRSDLKTAMKEKDKARLNVLRAILADVTNSAKTSNPIKTDMQLLSLLRKRASAAKVASTEFKAAGREDLVNQEEEQASIMNEYASSVATMSESDIRNSVTAVVEEAKAKAMEAKVNMGDIIKKVLGPGGILEGKNVDKSHVVKIVKEMSQT